MRQERLHEANGNKTMYKISKSGGICSTIKSYHYLIGVELALIVDSPQNTLYNQNAVDYGVNPDVFLHEVIYLHIFARDLAAYEFFGDTKEKNEVLDGFYAAISQKGISMNVCKNRLMVYTTALKTENTSSISFWEVGKKFASICGKEADPILTMFGSNEMSNFRSSTIEAFQNIYSPKQNIEKGLQIKTSPKMNILKWIGVFLLFWIAGSLISILVEAFFLMVTGSQIAPYGTGVVILIVIIGGLIWYGRKRKREKAKNGIKHISKPIINHRETSENSEISTISIKNFVMVLFSIVALCVIAFGILKYQSVVKDKEELTKQISTIQKTNEQPSKKSDSVEPVQKSTQDSVQEPSKDSVQETSQVPSSEQETYDEFGFPSSGYFFQEYSNDPTSTLDFFGLKTTVKGLYLTNQSTQDKFEADGSYYGRPLVIVTVEIENTKTTPVDTNIGSDNSQLSLSEGQIALCELVSPEFTGEIPAFSKTTVDLYFFPDSKIDLNTLTSAILNWNDYAPGGNQEYEQSITIKKQK